MAAYGQMPQNGGGFGRGNYMGGPQGGAFNNYGGYQA
jgi:nucleolysin TIA-1/TIAR